jgi:hypothetical protein
MFCVPRQRSVLGNAHAPRSVAGSSTSWLALMAAAASAATCASLTHSPVDRRRSAHADAECGYRVRPPSRRRTCRSRPVPAETEFVVPFRRPILSTIPLEQERR